MILIFTLAAFSISATCFGLAMIFEALMEYK